MIHCRHCQQGMALNAAKCTSISLEAAGCVKKMAVVDVPILQVGGMDIHSINVHQYLKYLDAEIGSEEAIQSSMEFHLEKVKLVSNGPLRPQQKVELLRSSILPTIANALSLQRLSKGYLLELDAEI